MGNVVFLQLNRKLKEFFKWLIIRFQAMNHRKVDENKLCYVKIALIKHFNLRSEIHGTGNFVVFHSVLYST